MTNDRCQRPPPRLFGFFFSLSSRERSRARPSLLEDPLTKDETRRGRGTRVTRPVASPGPSYAGRRPDGFGRTWPWHDLPHVKGKVTEKSNASRIDANGAVSMTKAYERGHGYCLTRPWSVAKDSGTRDLGLGPVQIASIAVVEFLIVEFFSQYLEMMGCFGNW